MQGMMSQREIPESEWRWRGMAGHLIVAARCCFHMVTDIGPHRVSTIGCYHPSDVGDPSQWSYDNRHTIGADRLYETMVFKLDGQMDQIVPNELDADAYNDEWEAERGHIVMCQKWARLATEEPQP